MKKSIKLSLLMLLTPFVQMYAQTSVTPTQGSEKTGSSAYSLAEARKIDEQRKWGLSASLNPGMTFRNPRFVIGADLQAEHYLTDLIGLTVSAGFTRITNKKDAVSFTFLPPYPPVTFYYNRGQNLIPLKLGLKLYAAEKLYLAGAAGIAIDINGNSNTVWSATAGAQLSNKFDLGLKYENYTASFSASNQIAVKLGYRIF